MFNLKPATQDADSREAQASAKRTWRVTYHNDAVVDVKAEEMQVCDDLRIEFWADDVVEAVIAPGAYRSVIAADES